MAKPVPKPEGFPSQDPARITPQRAVVLALSLLALVLSFSSIFIGFHNTVYGFHGFRQAQTAIAADYMRRGGSFLRYETPVLGPPWSVPFEFPIYQWLVGFISGRLLSPLDETGRSVSIVCFYLCFPPLVSVLRLARLTRQQIIVTIALFAASPIYIFVSRMFLIESMALLFSLCYVQQMFTLTLGRNPWRYRNIVGAALFGALAGLEKATSFAAYLLLGAAVCLWQMARMYKSGSLSTMRAASAVAFCGLLPLSLTVAWVKFSDKVKAENPISADLTSKSLQAWNYGTLNQRLHLRNYLHILKNADYHVGSLAAVVVVISVYAWIFRRANGRALICVLGYCLCPLIFFNLYIIHEYYAYANALFLIAGLGILIGQMLSLKGGKSWIGVGMFALVLLACAYRYHAHYYPLQANNDPGHAAVSAILNKTIAPDSLIVVMGLDWSPELPYQSGHRAIMDREIAASLYPASAVPVQRVVDEVGQERIGALVACNAALSLPQRVKNTAQTMGLSPTADAHAEGCDIYFRK